MPAEFPPGLNFNGSVVRQSGSFARSAALETAHAFKTGSGVVLAVYIFNTNSFAQYYGIYDCVANVNRNGATNLLLPVLIAAGTGQLISLELPFSTGLFVSQNVTTFPSVSSTTGVADSWYAAKFQ